MLKRWIATAAVAACTSAVAFAASQATFILNNGQRQSGEVVFHGGHGYNMIDEQLNLRIGSNEQSFPVGDVAVIDFVGGNPPERELQAVPASGNLIALRNGGLEQGRFVNIVNGQTVQWQAQDGAMRDYPIDQVSRIYLNAQGARTAYNYNGPMGQQAVGTSGQAAMAPAGAGSINVPANVAWTRTNVIVKKGDRVAFQTSGQVQVAPGTTTGPDGTGTPGGAGYPVAVMPIGGLVARVGNSAPFPIGSNTQPIVMPADGVLFLGVNDNNVSDNSGSFAVVITPSGR